MEEYQKTILLFIIVVFFVAIFYYFWCDRFYKTELFATLDSGDQYSNQQTIIPIDLGNTTLKYYQGKWANADIISKSQEIDEAIRDNVRKGFIYQDNNELAGTTEHNLDWKAYFSDYGDLQINGLPYNKESAWKHFYYQVIRAGEPRKPRKFLGWKDINGSVGAVSNTNFTVSFWLYLDHVTTMWQTLFHVGNYSGGKYLDYSGRNPGIWVWPIYNSLHVRQQTANGDSFEFWNDGFGEGTYGPYEYWAGEIDQHNIPLNTLNFCTFSFTAKGFSFYMNGDLKNNYTYENEALAETNSKSGLIAVGHQFSNPDNYWESKLSTMTGMYSYLLRDVNIYQDALNGNQAKLLYEKTVKNIDFDAFHAEAKQALHINSTVETMTSMTLEPFGIRKRVRNRVQQISNTIQNNNNNNNNNNAAIGLPPQITTESGRTFDFYGHVPVQYTSSDDDYQTDVGWAAGIFPGQQSQETPPEIIQTIELSNKQYNLQNETLILKYYNFQSDSNYHIPLHNWNDRIQFDGSPVTICFWIDAKMSDNMQFDQNGNPLSYPQTVFYFHNGSSLIHAHLDWMVIGFGCHNVEENRITKHNWNTLFNVNSNTWTHVAWVMTSDSWKCYINGELQSTKTDDVIQPPASSDNYTIFPQLFGTNDGYTDSQFFKGCLGDFRVYQAELNAEQIKLSMGDTISKYEYPQVFQVRGYTHEKKDAQEICRKKGAQLATKNQVIRAQKAGADWCSTGWVSDYNGAIYPINTSTGIGCGGGKTGIMEWTPPPSGEKGKETSKAAVNCYGIKPRTQDEDSQLHKWNQTKWNRYDDN